MVPHALPYNAGNLSGQRLVVTMPHFPPSSSQPDPVYHTIPLYFVPAGGHKCAITEGASTSVSE